MITIRDDGDHYTMEQDMEDEETIVALAYAAAQVHVEVLPELGTGLDMTNADDRAKACRAAAVSFGVLMETLMDMMLTPGEGDLQ